MFSVCDPLEYRFREGHQPLSSMGFSEEHRFSESFRPLDGRGFLARHPLRKTHQPKKDRAQST